MKRDEDVVTAAVVTSGVQRRPWTTPSARRLATSAAESNAAGTFDAMEALS